MPCGIRHFFSSKGEANFEITGVEILGINCSSPVTNVVLNAGSNIKKHLQILQHNSNCSRNFLESADSVSENMIDS